MGHGGSTNSKDFGAKFVEKREERRLESNPHNEEWHRRVAEWGEGMVRLRRSRIRRVWLRLLHGLLSSMTPGPYVTAFQILLRVVCSAASAQVPCAPAAPPADIRSYSHSLNKCETCNKVRKKTVTESCRPAQQPSARPSSARLRGLKSQAGAPALQARRAT